MKARDVGATLEDLDWLDQTGVGAIEAAQRADFPSVDALSMWLRNHDRWDLWKSLSRRDPSGSHKSGSDRKKERAMSAIHTDTIAALLDEAARHDRKRIVNKAERIRALVEDLRAEVEAEREAAEIREQAREDIERLAAELAEAKARLRGGSVQIEVGSGVSAADLRAWAASNGIECPPVGRVPARVREAYAEQAEAS